MAKRSGYRRSEAAVEERARPAEGGGRVTGWVCAGGFGVMVLLVMIFVAGSYAQEAMVSLVWGIFSLTILAAAGMAGLALTEGAAKRGVFEASAMPAVWRAVVSIAMGLGLMGLVTLGLGTIGVLEHEWVAGVVVAACAGGGLVATRRFFAGVKWGVMKETVGVSSLFFAVCAAVPVGMMLLAAAYPPGTVWGSEGRGYDVLEYHLELPREYAENGSAGPVGHNVYSYLPANVEMVYTLQMQLAKWGLRSGNHLDGVMPAAYLHVGMMVLVAVAILVLPVPVSGLGRALGAIFFLSVPWTIVTGSLAYNEGGMMLWGVVAVGMAMGMRNGKLKMRSGEEAAGPTRVDGACGWAIVLTGVFLGLAVGAKLTAGFMFAVPVAVMLVCMGRWKGAVLAGILAGVLFLPWGVRAAVGSGGNPVFPIGAKVLGKGAWTMEQVEKWDRGHAATAGQRGIGGRLGALADESIFNGQWGFGAGSMQRWMGERAGESRWARFGFVWAVILPLVVVAVFPRGERKPALPEGAMGAAWMFAVMLILQVVFWLAVTHLQARFLLPCAVPLAVLVGLGVDALRGGGMKAIAIAGVTTQAVATVFVLLPETGLFMGDVRSEAAQKRMSQMIGLVYGMELGGENSPEFGKRVCVVGDAAVLYYRRLPLYATVFDEHPLIEALRMGGAEGAGKFLREEAVDLLVVNWNEVERLRRTYGFDAAVTREAMAETAMRAGMRRVEGTGAGVDLWER